MSIYNKDCIFLDVEVKTDEEAITYIAEKLHEQGFVKAEFIPKVLEREKNFPTGLNCGGINVAVPHSDCELVNKKCLGICILKNPVAFHQMDSPADTVPVSVLFLFALTEPHAHIEMLQKVFEFIQKQELLMQLVTATDMESVVKILDEHF